jgi:hypothetical protein
MPKDEFDPEDPHALVGVAVPVEDGAAAQEALVRAFVEEYVRFGFEEERLLAVFRNPFYAGAHAFLRARGEEPVRALVREALARWRPRATGGSR